MYIAITGWKKNEWVTFVSISLFLGLHLVVMRYPIIGFEVAKFISDGKADMGILICKTGVGMVIIANKLSGVRAAACYDTGIARSSREHNDCNIVVLAADYTNFKDAKELVRIWLNTKHLGDRHERRV